MIKLLKESVNAKEIYNKLVSAGNRDYAYQKNKGIIFGKIDGKNYAVYTTSKRTEDGWKTSYDKCEEISDYKLDELKGNFSR